MALRHEEIDELKRLLKGELRNTYRLLGNSLPEEPTTLYKGENGVDSEGPGHSDYCLAMRHNSKIDSLLNALKRIEDGDIGICKECEEDIAFARLQKMPTAIYCIDCQTEREKTQKRHPKGLLNKSDTKTGQSYAK